MIDPIEQGLGGLRGQWVRVQEFAAPGSFSLEHMVPKSAMADFRNQRTTATASSPPRHVSPANAAVLAFLESWSHEPDDKGHEWWAAFEDELERSRGFQERGVE